MTRIVNIHHEECDIYIGRPSKWGNPFSSKSKTLAKYQVSSKKEAIEKYENYLRTEASHLLKDLHELDGKKLGCFCSPKSCHGDVLVKLIEEQKGLF